MKHILILEDDFSYRKMLSHKLSAYGRVFEAEGLSDALKIYGAGHLDFAIVDLDLEKKLDGLKFLEQAKGLRSIVLSSHDEDEIVEAAFELGAIQFMNKWDFDKYLKEAFHKELAKDNVSNIEKYYKTENIKLRNELKDIINLFKVTNQPLLIEGETGVGKGMLAKSLAEGLPYIHVNLSEFSKGTLESELFGHVKGAFTGANSDKMGLFKKADGGILFLDEIGTLSIELQKKLLRIIEEKIFYPVGSVEPIKSNFRLITATCDDLECMVKKNQFRKDFYYRISGLKVNIRPLRDRPEDVKEYIQKINKNQFKKIFINKEGKDFLMNYPWYGNYRELISFTDKLRGLSKGIVEKEKIESMLDTKILTQAIGLTFEMKKKIKENGLQNLVNTIELEALKWAREVSNGKLNESARLLNISKSLYYRIANSAN